MAELDHRLPGIRTVVPLRGANNSTQYNSVVAYTTLFGQGEETIKIEVGLREPLLLPAARGEAGTLLLDAAGSRPLIPRLPLLCLSRHEAMAEKLRAALSRREAAVRDFYDVDHAVHRLGFAAEEPAFLDLVRRKLAVPRTGGVDLTPARLATLRSQVEAGLKPVLRDADFVSFDLERAFATVSAVAVAVQGTS